MTPTTPISPRAREMAAELLPCDDCDDPNYCCDSKRRAAEAFQRLLDEQDALRAKYDKLLASLTQSQKERER